MWRFALLGLVLNALALSQPVQGPMLLRELLVLRQSGVQDDALLATVQERGLKGTATPLIRRALRNAGFEPSIIEQLLPPAREFGRTSLDPIPLSGRLPEAWQPEAGGIGFRARRPALAGREAAVFSMRLIERAPRPEDAKERRTLEGLFEDRLAAARKTEGVKTEPVRIFAAYGLSGLWTLIEKPLAKDRLRLEWTALFSLDLGRQVIVRLETECARSGLESVRGLEAEFLQALRSLAPPGAAVEALPDEPVEGRIAVLTASESGVEVLLLGREGDIMERLESRAAVGLATDPTQEELCCFGPTETLRFGPLGERRGPGLSARHMTFGPDQAFIGAKEIKGLGTAELCSPTRPLDGMAIAARAVEAMQAIDLHLIDLKAPEFERTAVASLRPAQSVGAAFDPGSEAILCLVNSTHWPLPDWRAGTPATAHRLLYLGPEPGVERPLLVHHTKGADAAPYRNPRFALSAREILFLDAAGRLLVLPRQGGLPLVLHPGPCLAVEPWIDLREPSGPR